MRCASLLILSALLSGSLSAGLRDEIEPFLDSHCYGCHDDIDNEGGLNLLDLKFDPESPKNRKIWEQVFHRVETGEMPPKKKKRPAPEDISGFLKNLEAPLVKSHKQSIN